MRSTVGQFFGLSEKVWGILAERVGFEPTVAFATPAFQASLIGHSSTSPHIILYIIRIYEKSDYITMFPFMLKAHVLASGGEGGIRTHAPLNAETAFRERHHQPLGHLSKCLK